MRTWFKSVIRAEISGTQKSSEGVHSLNLSCDYVSNDTSSITLREVTHSTRTVPCTCSMDHAKPLLLMTQQMVSAFIPSWFSTQLHTDPAACCAHPAPAMALLWHYSQHSLNFTVIHVSFRLPVGLLITILKMQ